MGHEVVLDGSSLTAEALARVAEGAPVRLCEDARARMSAHHAWYIAQQPTDAVADKWTWMGAGELPSRPSLAFIRGHCTGTGEPLPEPWVRAVMAARANVLASGHSGVRPEAVDVLLRMLAEDVIPVVPAQGSVGAAGSASLAHIAEVACGIGGRAWVGGVEVPAAEAMARVAPLDPTSKEALSLLNGSTVGTALSALALHRAQGLLTSAEAACALSMEAFRADSRCIAAAAMEARRHPGAVQVAERLRAYLEGSGRVSPAREPDPFSLRCAPTVLGAVVDALDHVQTVIERELNASVDNPLVFPDSGIIEAGNFHGAPVSMATDHLRVAMTQVASISERRTYRLTYGSLSGLPSFLVTDSGVNSGLMLAQYTAASLVSECKGLAHPAAVDSIPTVQHNEDHVSMGPISGRSALELLDIVADVLGIELMCAAQAIDLRPPAPLGAGSEAVYRRVRERVERWTDDRVIHPDLKAIGQAVRGGVFEGLLDA